MAETVTFNEEAIPDEGKLVAFSLRGNQNQFSLGNNTLVRNGDTVSIENQVLTLPVPFFSKAEFKIVKERKWKFQAVNFENELWVNKVQVTTTAPVELYNGCPITIVSKDGKVQNFVFQDHYEDNTVWKTLLLINYNRTITLYSEEAMKSIANHPNQENTNYEHADIYFRRGQWVIEEVNIKSGVWVNGKRIKEPTNLHLYDVVRIGHTIFVYMPGRLYYSSSTGTGRDLVVHIEERSIQKPFSKKRVILKDINLTLTPGKLILLLGGSGAGKTTLINAITGYEPAQKATVLNGGVDVYKNYNQMKYDIGVVPQQDLLRSHDTVFETLLNAAQLRMPAGVSDAEKKARVHELLDEFGLDHQEKKLVKTLSGGQRKRLSICCEYISDPSLFILDEPDSGLDGVIAKELFSKLRKIADSGRIVLTITHSPDRVLNYFDDVIVIAKDKERAGRLVFYGSIDEAKQFFERDNMEDIVKLINPVNEGGEGRADELVAKFSALRKAENNG